jgi:paraquat-inducible protein B
MKRWHIQRDAAAPRSGTQPLQGRPAEPEDELPRAVERPRRQISPIWIVPLVAALVLAYLAYQAIAERGPTITVTFKTADGLQVEQTEVKHKAVALGTVKSVELSERGDRVVVRIAMDARAKPMLTESARFWVVRPRLKSGGLSALQTGLETLVSGSYIELDPGARGGPRRHHFTGLEQPPAVRSDDPGTPFVLAAQKLGPIGAGSPILHRQMQVGEVLGSKLDEHSGTVYVSAFVRAPYDKLVVDHSCFWNASGLDVHTGADGLHLEVASLRIMFSGGIAFDTPQQHAADAPAAGNHTFRLFPTEAAADVALHGTTVPYVAYFGESLQGLGEGSPVKLLGSQVGNVTELGLALAPGTGDTPRVVGRVGFVLQPERAPSPQVAQLLAHASMREQAAHGLRVVLETSNYLTGEKALALSYQPGAKGGVLSEEQGALVLPSQTRSLERLTDALGDIASRLQSIPYEQIGKSLDHTLRSIDRAVSGPDLERAIAGLSSTLQEVQALAHEARSGLAPALARLPDIAAHVDQAVESANAALTNLAGSDGEFQRNAQHMLTQVAEMARSVRLLADFLERHPETLVRGRVRQEAPP